MKSEVVPHIKLEIRPMIMSIIQSMGIEGSTLAQVIEKKVEEKTAKIIAEDLNFMVEEALKEHIQKYLTDKLHPVAIQIGSGNLDKIIKAVREKYPNML